MFHAASQLPHRERLPRDHLTAPMGSQFGSDARPLILHVVYRFDTGGLENGLVNLINHMAGAAYRHAVLSLTEVTDFRRRLQRDDVETFALHKPPGHGIWLYPQLFRLFRRLKPAIVHTRNMAALESVVPAWLAGVPVRIHGEHGREGRDLNPASSRYTLLRRAYRPFVSHYIALSSELVTYLSDGVRVQRDRISHAYNGVDTVKFTPSQGRRVAVLGCPFVPGQQWLVGTVGRLQPVKDQLTLARAFVRVLALQPELRSRLRLVMVGDGPLLGEVAGVLQAGSVADLAWLPGERTDIPDVLRMLDCFVLPSQSEGISNVILEAMASALPVLATDVGGNAELVAAGRTGVIVPPQDPEAMARALADLVADPGWAHSLGRAGRDDVERRFSMDSMVATYQGLYDRLLVRGNTAPVQH